MLIFHLFLALNKDSNLRKPLPTLSFTLKFISTNKITFSLSSQLNYKKKRKSIFFSPPLYLFFLRPFMHFRTRNVQKRVCGADARSRADTRTQTERESVEKKVKDRNPKHQNSINPQRRSLKGFSKADVQHTEAFQVNTVCGGNAAEAFMLHALTFPLCYFLFLHLSLSFIFYSTFLPFCHPQ